MSWKETCPMTERMRFLSELLEGEREMSELCRLYGISRKTGYKWRDRYERGGPGALEDRSHARLSQAHAIDEPTLSRLVQVRRAHPTWGPRKLLAWLQAHDGSGPWPAASTVGDILRRNGLVEPRRRRRPTVPRAPSALVQPEAPNDLWCTDFKGQFRMQDGRYCYPLTLTDAVSRYLLVCQGVHTPSAEQVKPWLERAFRQYGLPTVIRSDNGAPFASNGIGGLSQLSIWWVKLGIVPELIEPGCPQQNGRHERMHRTLKNEATRPAAADLRAQQRKFDQFTEEFNAERPHEALLQRPPQSVYQASLRPYPKRLPPIEYPQGYQVRQVRQSGEIKFGGRLAFVGQALCHEPIGLVQIDNDLWQLYFSMVPLGYLDTYRMKVHPIARRRKNRLQVRGAAPPAPPAKFEKVLPISPV